MDFIVDTVETSKAVGAPVKVMWTREDDMRHGFYRPATYNVFRAALDARGMPAAWWNRVVGPGILIQKGRAQAGTVDGAAVEGVRNFPYNIPNVHVEWTNKDYGIHGQITIDHGRVEQSNFNDYPMLRINETPVTEVHILNSGEAPGGLGEPGVPTTAPAVCNAIFALTGKRVRALPIRPEELKGA